MNAAPTTTGVPCRFARFQAELPDLAYDLERQGRRDAADVVMQIYARARDLAEDTSGQESTSNFHHEPN
jgi:aminoglycoside phosphotransferase family enzyme